MKKKRSVILFLACIVATVCLVYVASYMAESTQKIANISSAEAAGTSIAMAMATPSVICSGIGTFFSWLGFFSRKRGFALTAGILFAVAMVLMIPWLMFNMIQMVLCFIAYATMKK